MNRMVTTVDDALEWAKSGDMNCGPQTEAAVKIMAAELSRLRGAAVQFVLSEPELTAFRQWDCNERMGDAAFLAGALRRSIDDLEFAQQQHAIACRERSEAHLALATALGLLKRYKKSAHKHKTLGSDGPPCVCALCSDTNEFLAAHKEVSHD